MGIEAGPPPNTGDTIHLPDIRILNDIHRAMGQIMSGYRVPRYVMLGRGQYERLLASGFSIFKYERPSMETGVLEPTEYVMGVEIIRVQRDDFLEVI